MKKTLAVAFCFCVWYAHSSATPVNSILGDESFRFYFGKYPDKHTSEQLRISTHLRYVEWYLRSASVTHLDEKKKQSRKQMLDLLHYYRLAEQFPVNTEFQERRPCFIDQYDNICAVGYLIEQTAGLALAKKINARYQYEYIENMHDIPELKNWVEHSGLTLLECAMIQPAYMDSSDGKIGIAESKISRDSLVSYLSHNIFLPDSFLFERPQILNVSFNITNAGGVSRVKLDPEYPRAIRKKIVKTIKQLRFKPAVKYNYLRAKKRYTTNNVRSKETMWLIFCLRNDQHTVIRNRHDLFAPESDTSMGHRIIRQLIEIYERKNAEGERTIKLKGVLTDFKWNYLSSLRIHAKDQTGATRRLEDIPLHENRFETELKNNNYTDLKVELIDTRGAVAYTIPDVRPVTQTLVMTVFDKRNYEVIYETREDEYHKDTKKAWYQPMILELR